MSDLTEFTQDEHNANVGTDRGREMLLDSIRDHGAARSIVVSKDGKVIAGNKTLQAAIDAGVVSARVVETDGRRASCEIAFSPTAPKVSIPPATLKKSFLEIFFCPESFMVDLPSQMHPPSPALVDILPFLNGRLKDKVTPGFDGYRPWPDRHLKRTGP